VKICPICAREYSDNYTFCDQHGSRLVDHNPAPPPLPLAPLARLLITASDGSEREFELPADAVTIGKADENQLRITDGSISRKHAVIEPNGGGLVIKDLGSLNGIFVNDQRVGAEGHILRDGDRIEIGRTKMVFRSAPGAPNLPAPPPPPRSGHLAGLLITEPDGAAREFELPATPITVGRSVDNQLFISDNAVSRKHASIEPDGANLVIKDLGSAGGIFVNGYRVGEQGHVLREGDRIRIGRTEMVFRARSWAPPLPPVISPPAPKVVEPSYRVAPPGAPTEVSDKDLPWRLDGRYDLEAKLSEDSNGTLYRARRLALNDYVAVRVLRPELVKYEVAVERFRRQAQVAARIKHPNSVQVFDFGYSPEGAAYIVEELLSGRTLRDLVRQERGLSLATVINIFNQICGAVHTAHLNGIVLRDLKPETIYVEQDAGGQDLIKVGGYGLAKVDETISQGKALTGPLGVYGLPQYASPEQLVNRQLDGRSDVYSLGVILFELLTGTTPFNSDNLGDLVTMQLTSPAPDITEFGRSDLDEGVAAVVSRALAKEPEQRQPSALQLAEELQAVSGARGGVVDKLVAKATRMLPPAPIIVAPAPGTPSMEVALPTVVPEVKEKGRGAFNAVVLALMAEAFLSRLSSGLIKTAVPLYALLVFGLDITAVMGLVLIQNIVPLLLRPAFGSLADKYGKKNVFIASLTIRTAVSLLYAVATLPLLFVISVIRGIADSAKGPSASAMIADHTDEKSIAQAYSWYTTTKSTSGGIGEALAAFALTILITLYAGLQTVNVNVAVLDKTNRSGANLEEIVKSPDGVTIGAALPGKESDPAAGKVLRVEQRETRLSAVPIEDLPKVVDATPLKQALVTIFLVSTIFSLFSLILVQFFIKEKKKEEKKEKKEKSNAPTGVLDAPGQQPNVWAFSLLGMALTAPAYMVTGEFFVILAVKLEVTTGALGWIKLLAETVTPLLFGPFFGWLADRIGAGKVIALRSLANLLTSALFWITPWFAGTALLGLMMGLARGIDEIGKAAFKPTWGAIAAKVSSFNLARRGKTMGILEGGVDASDLAFPVIAGVMLQYLSLGPLMLARGVLALVAEIYGFFLMRKYKI
jgi:eukaryotic-like serine/threonine-protein kinase